MTDNQSDQQTEIRAENIGVVGDHAHVEGGIHFHALPISPTDLRNRKSMLQLVHNFWIQGVLEQSLHSAAMLELGMEYNPDAVEHPWDMVIQVPDQPEKALPQSTKIIDVFDQFSGTLLILGEPGSGKTTTLLELARAAIARAESDPAQYFIPVVFNLSSWAEKQQPLADWLVAELNTKYHIPQKVARPWVEDDALLFLLDGLDEVRADRRDACVAAINAFCQEHLVPIVVCSRTADYDALTAKLHLQGAISLRPLTPAQIDAYLVGVGTELQTVRATLQHDPVLQEMAQSPLMLSIIALAYRGFSIGDLKPLNTPDARHQHLFDTYVQSMFHRRGKERPYTPEQTTHWLAYLAQHITAHAQTLFLIENIQPDWLPPRDRRRAHILAYLIFRLVFGLLGGLGVGFGVGPAAGLIIVLLRGSVDKLIPGMAFGLIAGLIFVFVPSGRLDFVKPIEALTWSWQNAISTLRSRLIVALVLGLIGGLGFGLVGGPIFGLVLGIVYTLGIGLIYVLGSGLSGVEVTTKATPNQGIRQSIRNCVIVGLIGGLAIGLIIGLVDGLVFGLVGKPDIGLVFGLICGLGVGLVFGLVQGGGAAAILHYTLRYVLYQTGCAPWNLTRFLDYCTDRILLRKVGGGYIFIHRLLQEHFAAMAADGSNDV
jgi:hypothetical protein